MLADQAADWLNSLPAESQQIIDAVTTAFKKRYALNQVDKWRKTTEIWSRKQRSNESVEDYITAMQAAASRVDMPEQSLKDAILQGLVQIFVYSCYILRRIRLKTF
jgi:hypothetical protein